MWVTNSSCGVSPVHYEMKGYNTLLGSHYDKYEIDYSDYSNSFPASIFVLKSNGKERMIILWPADCGISGAVLNMSHNDFSPNNVDSKQVNKVQINSYIKKFKLILTFFPFKSILT